jgi:hypothetical protein
MGADADNGQADFPQPLPRDERRDKPLLEDGAEVVEELSIVNEFAVAWVRKVRTRNGERLEIHSPRFGYTLRLDAVALEALSWQTPEATSKMLTHPLGPEEDDER